MTYGIKQSSFVAKWSEDILGHGFTAVPTLLLIYRTAIGLTPTECLVLITIDSFRWSGDNPWPSLKALSKRSGFSPRTLSRTITSLEEKGVITRIRRTGISNEYDLYPLVQWLDCLLHQNVPNPDDNIDSTAPDNFVSTPESGLSPKEYSPNNTRLRRKDINNVVLEGEVLPPGLDLDNQNN